MYDVGIKRVVLTGRNLPQSGQKSVAVAGIREAIGGDQEFVRITVTAKSTNIGNIYVGDSTVNSATGDILPPGGFVTFDFCNSKDIFINADNSGDGVSWIGMVRA